MITNHLDDLLRLLIAKDKKLKINVAWTIVTSASLKILDLYSSRDL